MKEKDLEKKLRQYNESYRNGKSEISDSEYDSLLDKLYEINPNNKLFDEIGHLVKGDRKTKLPINMYSLEKEKTLDDLTKWLTKKGINKNTYFVLTPKFDGVSLLVNELKNKAYTRGNGIYGQESDSHYSLISNKLINKEVEFTYGELIMSKPKFLDKYSKEFANPRNLVSGLMNKKEGSESLKDCDYIKYGAVSDNFKTKVDLLEYLNENQKVSVDYEKVKIDELSDEYLISLFKKWSNHYEIDGIVIELNDLSLQKELGREKNNNPVYARAYKHESFSKIHKVLIKDIIWNISKQGLLKPVAIIEPTEIDGVVVRRCTLNNAKFVKDKQIGIGSYVGILRSGFVIPKVVEVYEQKEFTLPNIENIKWNENGVELITTEVTDEQKIKKIISFFEILETDNVSEGVIRQLWDSGYKSIKSILNLNKDELVKLDRFGDRKAEIILNSIKKSTSNVRLSKLQHATGVFKSLGSRKLALLEKFKEKPTLEEVILIDGFSDKTANYYLDSYDSFFKIANDLGINYFRKDNTSDDNKFSGKSFVFTGVRRKDLEEVIENNGGSIKSSVSDKTTYVVCKDLNSKSSKVKKAKAIIEDGGDLKLMNVNDLESLLKNGK